MCGICGIINLNDATGAATGAGSGDAGPALRAMTETLRHRGPDDEGFFTAPHATGTAALGMRRLSIIDIEGGHQPIFNEDETAVIVFNGEIYNFRELRPELEAAGHSFRTRTDTEVILHLYEELGPACLERLRGMFAFAIYDIKNRTLFLARDRIGIKPLVHTTIGGGARGTLVFASEIKAIRAHPGFKTRLHLPSLARYLTHLYIPGEETIFEGVRRLPPAHYLLMTPDG
ncbi:MAG: asparagine synthetase B, partial [bacterium]